MVRVWFGSLRVRLICLVVLAMLPALGLVAYTGLEHRRSAAEHAKEDAMRLVHVASGAEKHLFDATLRLAQELAHMPEMRESDAARCSPLFGDVLKQHREYINLGAADPSGKVFCSAIGGEQDAYEVNIADRPYFQEAIRSHGFSIGNYQIDRIMKRPTVNFGYPVLDEENNVRAVIFAALDLSWFQRLAVDMHLPEGWTLTVRDREGTILVHYPNPELWVSRSVPEASILKAIMDHGGEGTAEASGVDNVQRLYAFTSLGGDAEGAVYLSVGIPADTTFADNNRELFRNMTSLAIAAFLAILGSWLVGEFFILRRVNKLVSATKQLAEGNLSMRVAEGGFHGQGELDQLAWSFDEMAKSLEDRTNQLRETEAKYRAMVEQIPAITYTATIEEARHTLFISPQIEVMLGFSPEEWMADHELWQKQIHPEDLSQVLDNIRSSRVMLAKTGFRCDYRLLARDGREIWVRDEAEVVPVETEPFWVLQGILRDITERKQAMLALHYSENKYRAIFETTGTATIIIDEDTAISLANSEFIGLSGYHDCKDDSLKGRSWTEFFLEEDVRKMKEYHRLRRIDPKAAPRDYECRFVDNNGKVRHMIASVAMIPGTDRSVASFLDITERKRAEESMRKSEERYRQFFEDDLTGDFIADIEGRVIAYNPAFGSMFSFDSLSEARKCTFKSIFIDMAAWEKFLDQVRENKKLTYWEAELRRCDGRPIHVIGNVIGTFDEQGEPVQIKGYFFDDTDRKKLEEQFRQAQKMEAVGRLAGGVAHDFNNMLTIITGYSEILLERLNQNDSLRKYIEEIGKAGERAASLTRQLLAFSRKQMLQPKVLNLNTTVTHVEKMLRRLIGEDIQLTTRLASELGKVKADPGQIEQVIMNLVVNARDAMPHGGQISIETANVDLDNQYARLHLGAESGSYVMIAVSDNGMGMDAETQVRIFEPFFTTKEQGKGTGLGLSTVYGIVRQSGGHVWVSSEVGIGTSFRVYLPRIEMNSDPEQASTFGALNTIPFRGTETILLVEDEEMVRKTIRRILERSGYNVLDACQGDEAILIHEQHLGPIHLLLTDVIMPRMNGHELAQLLRPLRPEMKVLFVSGYTDNSIVDERIPGLGALYLQKPFTPVALTLKVREILDKKDSMSHS